MYHLEQNKWYLKKFYLPISKLQSILAVPNLIAHSNLTISYYGQVRNEKPLEVPFILLLTVHAYVYIINSSYRKEIPIKQYMFHNSKGENTQKTYSVNT